MLHATDSRLRLESATSSPHELIFLASDSRDTVTLPEHSMNIETTEKAIVTVAVTANRSRDRCGTDLLMPCVARTDVAAQFVRSRYPAALGRRPQRAR